MIKERLYVLRGTFLTWFLNRFLDVCLLYEYVRNITGKQVRHTDSSSTVCVSYDFEKKMDVFLPRFSEG